MRKLIQIFPFLAIIALSAILLVKVYGGYDRELGVYDTNKLVGKIMPEFEVEDILSDDANISKLDLLGKYTVLNFFSSWCVSCKLENPILLQMADTKDIQVIGVAWRDKKNDTLTWLSDNGNPYDKVGYDDKGIFGVSLGIRGIPETFLVDKEGRIIAHYVGNLQNKFFDDLREHTGIIIDAKEIKETEEDSIN